MSIYQFDPEDAKRFAHEQNIKYFVRGDELQFKYCPYCRNKTDDKNTFSINLRTGQFKCLRATCGAKGNMLTLSRDFGFSLGKDVDEYYNRTRQYRNLRKYSTPEIRDPAIQYMKTRGISEAITRAYQITTQKEHDNIIVFPFYDEDNELQFVKYRKADFDKTKDKNKEWCEANCKPILFGMNHCYPDESKVLVMTEGQIDSLSVAEAFHGEVNVVSVPTGAKGFTWIPYCWDFLGTFKELIVFGDHENDKITLLEEMTGRFHGTVKHVRPDDYKDCKDANDLLRKYGPQAVIDAVENAVQVENPRIKKLSEVKKTEEEVYIGTGISQLDRIFGGFPLGRVVILTGERGLGKSTLASQFILEAVDQGFPALIYSGELTDWNVQEWFDRQAAGRDHINVAVSPNGFKRYLVNADIADRIHKWYDTRLYIRENSYKDDDEEEETILDTVCTAVKQYGVKVVLIDNLMTAIEDDLAVDLYRQQSAFVRKCMKLTKDLKILIFIVVHPRKMNGKDYFTNDDVSGSSNITNLADLTLSYTKPAKDFETDATRVVQLIKNRINGTMVFDGIPLYYEEESKRITETLYPLKVKRYGWEDEDTWSDADDLDTIPF